MRRLLRSFCGALPCGILALAPPALAQDTRSATLCVIGAQGLAQVAATRAGAEGAIYVSRDGRQVRIEEAYPDPAPYLAAGADWYVAGEPIRVGGRRYVKYGLPRQLAAADVAPLAAYRGVGVFAETGAIGTPEVVYVAVHAACAFQPYQQEADAGEQAPPAPTRTPLPVGQVIRGDLAETDHHLDDGSFFDEYTFAGHAGQRVRITLRATGFDAYLNVGRLDDGDFVTLRTDDDGAGGTDALVELTLPVTGTYVVRANSLGAAETGAYTVHVEILP